MTYCDKWKSFKDKLFDFFKSKHTFENIKLKHMGGRGHNYDFEITFN